MRCCSFCRKSGHTINTCIMHYDKIFNIQTDILRITNFSKKNKRKNADYQYTELLVSLIVLGLKNPISKNDIKIFANNMILEKKIECSNIENYFDDLDEVSNFKNIEKYVKNFKINEIDLTNIHKVYLTGKSYSNYEKIKHINQKNKDPTSDVYIEYLNKTFIGISVKKDCKCSLGNFIAEETYSNKDPKKHIEDREKLQNTREKLLNHHDITIDNYIDKRGINGEISKVIINNFEEYWNLLINHITKNEQNIIKRILEHVSGGIKKNEYKVFEYNGIELIDVSNRNYKYDEKLLKNFSIKECIGEKSFDLQKNGEKRNAAKKFLKLLNKERILYRLEIRFKGKYFGESGSPQIFIFNQNQDLFESEE